MTDIVMGNVMPHKLLLREIKEELLRMKAFDDDVRYPTSTVYDKYHEGVKKLLDKMNHV